MADPAVSIEPTADVPVRLDNDDVRERLAVLDEQLARLEATPGPIGELALVAVSGLAEIYGQALARATEYATHLASLRPETLGATKRVLNQWLRLGLTQVYDQGLALEFMTFPKSYADSTRGGGNGS